MTHDLMQRGLHMSDALGGKGDSTMLGLAWGMLSWISFDRGEYQLARSYHEREKEQAERLRDEWALAMCLVNMGEQAARLEKYDEAEELIHRSLSIHRRMVMLGH